MTEPQTFTEEQVREMLREACAEAGSQSSWARTHLFSAQYVTDILSGRRAPGNGVSRALGLKKMPDTWTLDDLREKT
jgi:hypothetical protein